MKIVAVLALPESGLNWIWMTRTSLKCCIVIVLVKIKKIKINFRGFESSRKLFFFASSSFSPSTLWFSSINHTVKVKWEWAPVPQINIRFLLKWEYRLNVLAKPKHWSTGSEAEGRTPEDQTSVLSLCLIFKASIKLNTQLNNTVFVKVVLRYCMYSTAQTP